MLRDLWGHRAFVAAIVRREFALRSVRAVWGALWLLIQPAVLILIYTVVFGQLLHARLPGVSDSLGYGLFVCAGLITWGFFSELVLRSQNLFLEHAPLLKAVRFPRSLLPIALVLACSINFALIAGIFLVTLLFIGRWPGVALLGTIPLLAVQSLLAIGLGVLVGTLHVFFRDVGQMAQVLLQFWFWLTPIVYPVSIVPDAARAVIAWNPMFYLVSGYQRVILEHAMPEWGGLPIIFAAALASGLLSWWVFRLLSPDLVDEL